MTELPNSHLRYTGIRHMNLRLASACSALFDIEVREDDITAYSCVCNGMSCYDCEMSAVEAGSVLNGNRCPSCGKEIYGGQIYDSSIMCLKCGLIMYVCIGMYLSKVISGAAKLPASLSMLASSHEDDSDVI